LEKELLKIAKSCFKKRKSDSHKGDNGKVLVIGGSADFVGAPALAAMSSLSALRAGTDLVTIVAPEKAGYVINTYSPDLIVKKLDGKNLEKKHLKEILKLGEKNDVVLIGPGAGQEKHTKSLVKELVKKIKKPLVLDADALKACSGMKFKGNVLVTPHEKEFEILFKKKTAGKKIEEKKKMVKTAAKKYNCIILLKGATDIISDGEKTILNKTGNAGMTVGGTGDVLAGLCAGIAAQGNSLFNSAVCGAFANGLIGDRLFKKLGHGMIASDFVQEIPVVLKVLSQK
jgi:hydroxyethylthiazole kinase-like uncharacterized protein yjeF